MSRVIHTGQALVDLVLEVPDLPVRGANVMAPGQTRYAGGAVNNLVASARTGALTVHAGAHGRGPNGDLIRATLAAEGVTVSAPVIADQDTGICVVLLEPSAERTFITTLGAERAITTESLMTSAPEKGDLICLTGYSFALPQTCEPLLGFLAELPDGVQVVLDPGAAFAGLDASIRDRVLASTTVWTGNQEECEQACGATTMDDGAAAMAALLPDGAVVVVRDGPKGCAVNVSGKVTEIAGFPQKPLDTNGAGDTHTGVLMAHRALGDDWETAARRANAAAAIKVTRRGPASCPTRAEVDAFLAEWDQRG